jgi:periplasmic protein CpxP/Spy
MVRKTVFSVLIALFTFSICAFAQDEQQPQVQTGGHEGQWGRHDQMDPKARAQHLTKQLDLNSDQQAKVQSILEDLQKQMAAMRNDNSTSQQDRRAQFMQLRQTTSSQIRAVLNPDQQKKFDAMEHREMVDRKMKEASNRRRSSPMEPACGSGRAQLNENRISCCTLSR